MVFSYPNHSVTVQTVLNADAREALKFNRGSKRKLGVSAKLLLNGTGVGIA